MNSSEIQNNVEKVIDEFDEGEFIYDLLLAYGISKASIKRLRLGDYNLSDDEGTILFKKKIFFKKEKPDMLLQTIESMSAKEEVRKHAPRFLIATDYRTLVAKDLKLGKNLDIQLKNLGNYFDFFLPLAGTEVYKSPNDNEADRDASYKMATLYDLLKEDNPQIYDSADAINELNIFLSRILFCFFAEDTDIFETSIFTETLVRYTKLEGVDTDEFFTLLFEKLNSKSNNQFPQYFNQFPHVNGGLFKKEISVPKFSFKARKTLVELGELQWRNINPDIFGSMIQAVVVPEYRSDLGMHYTSVSNILKLIRPLFLDELYEEFEKIDDPKRLRKLIRRISGIKFFDPACGSGNFLIITYKEIRVLEIKIIQKIIELSQQREIHYTRISLEQFYGIELDDFAHEMAILSLWLAEHQMNEVFEDRLLDYAGSSQILPLKDFGGIKRGNATRLDWKAVCPIEKDDEVYVTGNPPYLGSRKQNKDQKDDLKCVFGSHYKSLDYISAWFYKASRYILGHRARCAFVSTNSICQGLLVSLTWMRVLSSEIEIEFAYQSFKWKNSAKGNAGVSVVIIGIRNVSRNPKYLFQNNLRKKVRNITPYLTEGDNLIVDKRESPISIFPQMNFGNMPADGGNLILSELEKNSLIESYPSVDKWIKPLLSAKEFLNGVNRYCLWLEGVSKEDYLKYSLVKDRIEQNYTNRLNSSRPELAETPHLFAQITQPQGVNFILIPGVSSENREYIPIGYYDGNHKVNNSCFFVATNEEWLFAILTSRIHMVWVRGVGGRLKTDYRYSIKLCYNTFPFPEIDAKQKENLKLYAYSIIEERAKHPTKTLAQLYDPEKMPKELLKAHDELDRAVERCYRLKSFENDTERLEYLLKMYQEMSNKDTIFSKQRKTRKSKN